MDLPNQVVLTDLMEPQNVTELGIDCTEISSSPSTVKKHEQDKEPKEATHAYAICVEDDGIQKKNDSSSSNKKPVEELLDDPVEGIYNSFIQATSLQEKIFVFECDHHFADILEMKCLWPITNLNDTVINCTVNLLALQEEKKPHGMHEIWFSPTHFQICVPMHHLINRVSGHWYLLVIDIRYNHDKAGRVMDCQTMLNFLDEWLLHPHFIWSRLSPKPKLYYFKLQEVDIPRQTNGMIVVYMLSSICERGLSTYTNWTYQNVFLIPLRSGKNSCTGSSRTSTTSKEKMPSNWH